MAERFQAGCRRLPPDGPGFTASEAERLWRQVVAFAGYGFNQGHATPPMPTSADRTAYLKAHWPAAYLAARLGVWGGFHHPAVYIAEAVRLGIAVRPPHINHSDSSFTLAWVQSAPVLWMGLGQVRDLRNAAVEAITAERQKGLYQGLRDTARRVCRCSRRSWCT